MKRLLIMAMILIFATSLKAQSLQLLDRFNDNKVVNDSTILVFSSESGIPELTQYFTMKNNTDRPLAVFLRKTVNHISDSTTDYFCFGVKCWPGTDTTDIADTIAPGGEDYTFASHVCHVRRFDIPQPPLPPGISSITYTVFDHTTFDVPVEASVTVIYHLSALGVHDLIIIPVSVFPNPASDRLTIIDHGLTDGAYRLMIHNFSGVTVLSNNVNINGNQLNISTNELPAGIYLGHLSSLTGQPVSFRFAVVK